MEYFLSIAGGQSGPHTQPEIIGLIRDGTLKGNELAWRKGFLDWRPLRELDEFEGAWPVTPEMVQVAEAARTLARKALDAPQPWNRFWARMVDYMWFTLAFWFLLAAVLPAAALHWLLNSMLLGAPLASLFLLAYIPVEAWLLSRNGTTQGKALMCVQVRRTDGALATYKQALMRSLLVYIKGVALWLPIVSLFMMSYWRIRLLQRGFTSWDEATALSVEHGEPETWRFLLVALFFAGLLGLALLFSLSPAGEEMMRDLPK